MIDFNNVSADDFKVVGNEPEVSPEVTPEVSPEPAPTPEAAPTPDPTPTPEPVKEPVRNFKDDFIKGVVEFYEKTGDLTPYLQAKTVDFTQMSDEEIMRRSLREQYSDLSDKAFDRLYKQQVVDKFKLDQDEWGEEDSELGRELLKSEATKLRSQYLDWQQSFRAPEPEGDNTAELMQQFEQEVLNNDITKSVLGNKKITINTPDGEFNYEIPQADALFNMTIDNEKFFSQFAPDGKLDYAKWYKTAAYSQNPEMFERALINYGKTLGRSEVTKEIRNPSSNQVPDVNTEGSGDFRTSLLQAFASRGISK
jgi:hypothetical protein